MCVGDGSVATFGQALDQRVDAGACSAQPRPERIALMRQRADLFAQLCVGPQQRLVAQQELLDALGDLADLGGLVLVRHGNGIVGFAAFCRVESGLLVLAV